MRGWEEKPRREAKKKAKTKPKHMSSQGRKRPTMKWVAEYSTKRVGGMVDRGRKQQAWAMQSWKY